MRLDNEMDFSLSDINTERIKLLNRAWGKIRDEDPDPVGSVDFWPTGSGTFFNGSGSGSYL